MNLKNINESNLINILTMKVRNDQNLHEQIAYKLYALCQRMESCEHNEQNRFYFQLPVPEVLSFSETLGIDEETGPVFWAGGDEYYRLTMALTSIGLSISDNSIARNAYQLMLARLWNNIIDKSLPEGINTSTMDIVIKERLSQQHLLKKRTIYDLIGRYYVLTILRKYGRDVTDNPRENAGLLLSQGRDRIYRIFHGNVPFAPNSAVRLYKEVEAEIKNKTV